MIKYVYVQVINAANAIQITGDKVVREQTGGLSIFRGEEKIGEFGNGTYAGWWYGPDSTERR